MPLDLKELCAVERQSDAFLTVKDFAQTQEFFTFRGIATTPKVDLVGDIVEPMGAEYALPIKLLSKHDSHKPIGNVTFAKVGKAGIEYEARIPIVKEAGAVRERVLEAIHEIKHGLVANVSIGFKPIAEAIELLKDTGGLRFKRWRWLELSLAPVPANDEATITAFKSANAQIRTALGAHGSRGATAATSIPGAAGSTSKGTTMKTLKQLLEERGSIAARMKELNDGCGGDFGQLSDEDRGEFDGLSETLETLDVDIRRAKAIQVAISGAVEVPKSAGSDPESGARARMHREPKQGPKLEKGIAFAQYVKFLGKAKGNIMHAQAMAEAAAKAMPMYIDPRVPLMLKADVEAGSVSGTTTAGNWGMELVGSESGAVADFAEWLRPQTILGKFGTNGIPALNRVPFRAPLVGATSGGSGYWVGEGKAKPLTKFGFSRDSLAPLKIAAITAVTQELLMDSTPAADTLIRNMLRDALVERADQTFIDPAAAAVAGVSPASITNGVSGTGSAGVDSAGVRADVRAAFAGYIAANNAPTTGVWIMSATTALALGMMQNALGNAEFPGVDMNGGRFAGMPVIVSEYVPTDTGGHIVVLVNARDIYYADDGGITVRTSDQASLEMEDAPSNDSVTPSGQSLVSMFQTNSVAFLAEQRLNWMKRRDSAVQVITGADWGTGTT